MTLRNKLFHASAALAAAALASALIALPSACGGCYNDEEIKDLRTEPAADCLVLSTGGVDPCTGEYTISIENDCAESLALFSRGDGTFEETILPGASSSLSGSRSEARGQTRAFAGVLGTTSIEILWRFVPPAD